MTEPASTPVPAPSEADKKMRAKVDALLAKSASKSDGSVRLGRQKLVRTLGFRLRTDPDDPEQVTAELDLLRAGLTRGLLGPLRDRVP